MQTKVNLPIIVKEQHLVEKVPGILQFITTRNVIIFAVDNSSSCHFDNPKNSFLVLGDGATEGISGSVSTAEIKYGINLRKANTKFC